ncbi:hypothetical protein CP10881SC42_0966 [Chlamydia avium]|uniref:Uncharacterized protein n=1 Tax=Chlamydia avium TaxID=1457141 RepID=A0ABP2X5G2_9CHLA|nr:hypothetical protein CP10743SC13_0886 [Chlamydia psittaci 10_743_SC13]EPP38010.1 hypothetical protein CP10881SC42_0966 [Chlamydia avium]
MHETASIPIYSIQAHNVSLHIGFLRKTSPGKRGSLCVFIES